MEILFPCTVNFEVDMHLPVLEEARLEAEQKDLLELHEPPCQLEGTWHRPICPTQRALLDTRIASKVTSATDQWNAAPLPVFSSGREGAARPSRGEREATVSQGC